MGGLSLPQLLNAEAQNGTKRGFKSVIMVYLCGAPPHQDMWDLKMDAPAEIRGPYKPISTAVPGIRISEHAPRLAKMMDKLVPINSMYGSLNGAHDGSMNGAVTEPQASLAEDGPAQGLADGSPADAHEDSEAPGGATETQPEQVHVPVKKRGRKR